MSSRAMPLAVFPVIAAGLTACDTNNAEQLHKQKMTHVDDAARWMRDDLKPGRYRRQVKGRILELNNHRNYQEPTPFFSASLTCPAGRLPSAVHLSIITADRGERV
jgi:hypothetical protein